MTATKRYVSLSKFNYLIAGICVKITTSPTQFASDRYQVYEYFLFISHSQLQCLHQYPKLPDQRLPRLGQRHLGVRRVPAERFHERAGPVRDVHEGVRAVRRKGNVPAVLQRLLLEVRPRQWTPIQRRRLRVVRHLHRLQQVGVRGHLLFRRSHSSHLQGWLLPLRHRHRKPYPSLTPPRMWSASSAELGARPAPTSQPAPSAQSATT